ncbi:hypothetical protein JCM17823_04560 [Halorubrum gandharaense]
MSLGAAAGAASGLAGAGTVAGEDEWPDVDDPYYETIVEDLSERDLPAGAFRYADEEAATFEQFEVAGDGAEGESFDVDDDLPFLEAIRIAVSDEANDPWAAGFRGNLSDDIVEEGEVLLGVAYMRTPDEQEASVQYVAKEVDDASNYVRDPQPGVGAEWERYYFPIEFAAEGDPESETPRTEFWLGYGEQTVEIGGLALLTFGTDADVDTLPSWGDTEDEEDETDDGEWEAAADERIDDHRTDTLDITVVNGDGEPLPGADLHVEMTEHDYGFGTAVDAPTLLDADADDEYRETVTDLFNTAVLENHHKWRFYEDSPETADDATEWLVDHGLSMRGHACLWAAVDSWAVPPDVVEAMGEEWEDGGATDPELDPEYLRERSFDHVEEIISHYADFRGHGSVIDQWDVVNEVIHEPELIEAIDGDDADEPVEAPVLAEWYEHAGEVAPDGVELDMNDYNTLEGPYGSVRSDYEQQAEFLTEHDDVDLDGIGLQCHFSQGEALGPEDVWEGLEQYAAYDAEIRITEFDMADEGWDEADKADFFHAFLKQVYSHPATTDFVMWGFRDADHWRDDAPLFEDDWTPKPSHEVYTDLVFDEWWTDEELEADDAGEASVQAFHGTHEVRVDVDGETVAETVAVTDETTLELNVDAAGAPATETEPEDPSDGDGDETPEDEETEGDAPGFGVLPGLAALGGAAAYALAGRSGDETE